MMNVYMIIILQLARRGGKLSDHNSPRALMLADPLEYDGKNEYKRSGSP